jgi:hypothetical protein
VDRLAENHRVISNAPRSARVDAHDFVTLDFHDVPGARQSGLDGRPQPVLAIRQRPVPVQHDR